MELYLKETFTYLDVHLAYYGAYIDGEGHIGVKKMHTTRDKKIGRSPTYSERVSVASINKNIIYSFNDMLKGHVFCHKAKGNSREYWSWEVTDKKAAHFLRMIEPYLKVKVLEAKVVLTLTKNKEANNRTRLTEEDLKLREALYKVSKGLHH